jgi:transcriptional regulator NrdR family protein
MTDKKCECDELFYQEKITENLFRKCKKRPLLKQTLMKLHSINFSQQPQLASGPPIDIEKRNSEQEELGALADKAIEEIESQGETLESEGLGDTIEKVLSKFGISEEKISKIIGGSGCGCSKRKKWFNKIFGYKKEAQNE